MFRSSYHLRSVTRNIGILEQNALTMKWLQSFWKTCVDPVPAIRNVKVKVGYDPFIFIDSSSIKPSMKVSDSGSLT